MLKAVNKLGDRSLSAVKAARKFRGASENVIIRSTTETFIESRGGKVPGGSQRATDVPSGPADAQTRHIGTFCFVSGTPIVMADGSLKPIEQVQVGDQVLSRSDQSGAVAAKRVSHTFNSQSDATLVLGFPDGQRIETTRSHPFFVAGRGWVPAGEMGLGTSIVTRAGPSLPVQQITTLSHRSGGRRVYNFTVQDFHTYFVGSNPSHALWVHNAGESGWCAKFANTPEAKDALLKAKKFEAGETVTVGGKAYRYGASVKGFDLSGMSPDQIAQECTRRGFQHKRIELPWTKNGQSGTVPMDVYVHPDGGLVRVKPFGHPGARREPAHASKSMLKDLTPNGSHPDGLPHDFSFGNESFKVRNDDAPGAKWPNDLNNPHPAGTSDYENFENAEMDGVHTNL